MATPEQMTATMIANLKEKTDKTLEQWVRIAQSSSLAKHGEIVKFLKTEHGLGHGYANLVAHSMSGGTAAPGGGGDLVAAQYAAEKAGLRPIYDAVIRAAEACGQGVEVSPKKTYVSLRRSKQFALVQPSTKTRVDLGLQLKGVAPQGRLEASGSFNAMVTHRVRLESPKEVDAQVKAWLKQAYDAG